MWLGWALFGGFIATTLSVTGLIVSFVGSGWYSYIKLMDSGSKRAPVPTVMKERSPTKKEDDV